MSENHPEQSIRPILIDPSGEPDEDGKGYAENLASASGPGMLLFRILGGEAALYPDDMPASLRGLLEAARERGVPVLVIETDGGGAMLPGFPVREG